MYSLDKIALLKWSAYAESHLLPTMNKLSKSVNICIPQLLKTYQRLENIDKSMKIALLAAIITALFCYINRKLWLMLPQSEKLEKPLSTEQKINNYLRIALKETGQLALPKNYQIALRAKELEKKLRPPVEMNVRFYPHPKPFSIEECLFIQTMIEGLQKGLIEERILLKEVIEDFHMRPVETIPEVIEEYHMGPVEKA